MKPTDRVRETYGKLTSNRLNQQVDLGFHCKGSSLGIIPRESSLGRPIAGDHSRFRELGINRWGSQWEP